MIENTSGVRLSRHWPIRQQYEDLEIPDTWENLQEFVDWWMEERKPIMIPWDAEVICTDDAQAICLFRKGAFQVELYLIKPGYRVPTHSHPQMEVVTMTLGGGGFCGPEGEYGTSKRCGHNDYLFEGETHGGRTESGGGYALLSFEYWMGEGASPTSAAIQWHGPTAGPIHDELIAREKAK